MDDIQHHFSFRYSRPYQSSHLPSESYTIEKKMHATFVESGNQLKKLRGDLNGKFKCMDARVLPDSTSLNGSEPFHLKSCALLLARMRSPFPIIVGGRSRSLRMSRKDSASPSKRPFSGSIRLSVALKAKSEIANHIRDVRERIKSLRDRRL